MGKERMSTPATDARGLSDWEDFKQSFEGRRTWRTRWRWASFYIWRRILGWLIILAFVLCTRCEMELRSTRRQRTICTQLPPLPLHSLSSFVLLHNIHILRTILVFFLKFIYVKCSGARTKNLSNASESFSIAQRLKK